MFLILQLQTTYLIHLNSKSAEKNYVFFTRIIYRTTPPREIFISAHDHAVRTAGASVMGYGWGCPDTDSRRGQRGLPEPPEALSAVFRSPIPHRSTAETVRKSYCEADGRLAR